MVLYVLDAQKQVALNLMESERKLAKKRRMVRLIEDGRREARRRKEDEWILNLRTPDAQDSTNEGSAITEYSVEASRGVSGGESPQDTESFHGVVRRDRGVVQILV